MFNQTEQQAERTGILYVRCVCALCVCVVCVRCVCVMCVCCVFMYVLRMRVAYAYCICALLCYDENMFQNILIERQLYFIKHNNK